MAQPAPQMDSPDASALTIDAWRVLEDELETLQKPLDGPVVPIAEFLASVGKTPTPVETRKAIIDQAQLLFDHFYVHLPFKLEIYSGNPSPTELLQKVRDGIGAPETDFHQAMIEAFVTVRDAHTCYVAPSEYRRAMAFLPFQVATIVDPSGERRVIVHRVMAGKAEGGKFGHPFFGPGAEIIRWSGLEIVDQLRNVAMFLPAATDSASWTRATTALTLRPLGALPLPCNDEMPAVEIVYRATINSDEPLRTIKFPWGVATFDGPAELPASGFSISFLNQQLNQGLRLQCREDLWEEKSLEGSKDFREVSHVPEVFEFQFTGGPRQHHPIELSELVDPQNPSLKLGYMRIKAFSDGASGPGSTGRLVDEARRILELLDDVAPDGLVLDIRGNPGGDVQAAERILQMLTPSPITPQNFHLPNTKTLNDLLRNLREQNQNKDSLHGLERLQFLRQFGEFGNWIGDADLTPLPANDAPRVTSGRSLTHKDNCNDIGQVYHAPIVLLFDGNSYSAADIFAAGFDDHGIGMILGMDETTGGGGAEVWSHGDLREKLGPNPPVPLAALPGDVFMRVAIRRTSRVVNNSGEWIEDYGVKAHESYRCETVQDVLTGFPGVLRKAAEMLSRLVINCRVDVPAFAVRDDGSVSVDVRTNAARLKFFLNGQETKPPAADIKPGETGTFVLTAEGVTHPSSLRVEAYINNKESGEVLMNVRNVFLGR